MSSQHFRSKPNQSQGKTQSQTQPQKVDRYHYQSRTEPRSCYECGQVGPLWNFKEVREQPTNDTKITAEVTAVETRAQKQRKSKPFSALKTNQNWSVTWDPSVTRWTSLSTEGRCHTEEPLEGFTHSISPSGSISHMSYHTRYRSWKQVYPHSSRLLYEIHWSNSSQSHRNRNSCRGTVRGFLTNGRPRRNFYRHGISVHIWFNEGDK